MQRFYDLQHRRCRCGPESQGAAQTVQAEQCELAKCVHYMKLLSKNVA